jgi:site-specific DNA recombinase
LPSVDATQSLRDIAHDLNRESVRPPRGRRWNASTINGNAQLGAGLIFNELYAGRIVWNKVRMVKDPDTGERLSRPTLVMSGKASTCLNY